MSLRYPVPISGLVARSGAGGLAGGGGADGLAGVGGADGLAGVGGAGALGSGVPLDRIWHGPASVLAGRRLPSEHPARITATTLSSVMTERVDASNRTVRR